VNTSSTTNPVHRICGGKSMTGITREKKAHE
jgi:hypothetical protein